MRKFYFSKLFILFALLAGWNTNSWGQSTTFLYTGGEQTYVVPAGVTSLGVDAIGGCGGYPYWQCGNTAQAYALGGRVQCTLAVTPGTTLYIYVGGQGGSETCSSCTAQPGGFNGGVAGGSCAGGSGGATDIRLTPTSGISGTLVPPYTATNRLVVAGGGGGGADFLGNGGYGGGLTGGTGFVNTTWGGLGGNGGTQTGPGPGVGAATGAPYLGTLGVGGSRYNYSGGGGGYWGGNSGTGTAGGAGGGSSYTDPSLCTSVAHTQGYTGANGNGRVILTVLCTNPGTIVGATPLCPGSNITLTNPTGTGGSWISGNPAVATINSLGVVTGVSSGTAVITYLESNPCGGVSATTTITVLPVPGAITGTNTACVGNSTTLSDGGTGTWVSSNASVATISSTGVVTGITAGTATISYTLTTGCAPATTTVTIYPTPSAISGTTSVCASGSTTTLTDALTGGSWTSSSPSIATIGVGSGLVTGVTAGTTNITYTSANGCVIGTVVTVNPLPAPIAGVSTVCVGSTSTLTDATPGGTWSSSNASQASIGIGTGIVTGVNAGTPTVTYTLSGSGCKVTAPVVVNALPSAISGSTATCVGAVTTLTNSGGGTWSSSNTAVATVNTFTGAVTGVAPGTALIAYTLGTGCSTSTSILVNPLPATYTLTGGGNYCAGGTGVHVGVSYANSGVNYVLNNTGTPVSLPTPGSNAGLDFGLQTSPGVYTVVATNTITGCSSNMPGSVTVSLNPLPVMNNVTGGGGYCTGTTGSPVGTDGSQTGISYQLYNGTTAVGPIAPGTGTGLSFGSYTAPGTYTVLATNPATGCTQLQAGNAVINVLPTPIPYTVGGGGSYCAGGGGVHITLSNSEAGGTYLLYRGTTPVGSPIMGTGSALDFGAVTTAGTYTVLGTTSSLCPGNMTGSTTVVINPLPALNNVTGGGAYCAGSPGVHVGLSFSTPGISYALIYNGTGTVLTVPGSGSGLDFGAQTVPGVYTVQAVNTTTLCSSNMNGSAIISMNAVPDNSFSVSGTGSFCLGGAGRDITISGSEGSVNYQLFRGTTAVGSPIGGTGLPLDFGFKNIPGTYTVKAINSITGCQANLTGSAVITVNSLPVLHTVTGGGLFCEGGAGVDVALNGSNTGVTYQLIESGGIISTLSGNGSILDFGMQSVAGTYTVIAMDSLTGCTNNMLGSAVISINPSPLLNTVTGGGSYCAGGAGYHIGLDGSYPGISYRLFNGSTASGSALAGSGSALDFGLRTTAGIYTVVATNPLTGCTSLMNSSAIININALPNLQVVTGGGSYCVGGPGKDLGLANSDLGVDYQLYRGGIMEGAPVAGVGGTLSFGLDSFGVYTVKATDGSTGCTANMLGTITINTVSPTAFTVTGGGAYCAGGTGVMVSQSGSSLGVSYQLIAAGLPVGAPVAGTGSSLSFGSMTDAGIYTVQATDTTLGCVANMTGSATIAINPLPAPQTVTGGGAFCAGGTGVSVGLANSVTGVNYQLYFGTTASGSAVAGSTGAAVDFGLHIAPGTYTVVGTDATSGCNNLMSGSAIITIKPTPALYTVSADNGGNYCAADSGVIIRLANSETGVAYQLFRGTTTVGTTIAGTGSPLVLGLESVAGVYTVAASNPASGCSANMTGSATVNIVPLPALHTVTGGGGFCPSGAGVPVGLDGSQAGVTYQLIKDGTTPVSMLYGTGSSIDFGLQSATGTYTVVGNSVITTCQNAMSGNATVFYETLLTPIVTLQAYPGTGIGVWQVDSIKAFVTNGGANPTYQWQINGHDVPGATQGVFTHHEFFNTDSVSCVVTASGPCGGNASSKSITILLLGVGVKNVNVSGSNLVLAPNPNKGNFTLQGTIAGSQDEEAVIEVSNMLGQVVYTNKVKAVGGNIATDVKLGGNLANGMYILNLRSGTQTSTFHFVIAE